MSRSVICLSSSAEHANQIVEELKMSGFTDDDISVLFPDTRSSRDFVHHISTKAPEGTVAGAGTGGMLGGAVGLLAGIGMLVVPGVGPFVAAGPIMAALGGLAIGATVGGIAGALIGLGVPEVEARRYEHKVKDGNILLSVHTEYSDDIKRAKSIFQRRGANDIATAQETRGGHTEYGTPYPAPYQSDID